jgi:uncharacterized protein YaeQ
VQWIEVGQPDDRRLAKACGRAEQVRIWAYGSSTPIWWQGIAGKVARLSNLEVWQVPPRPAASWPPWPRAACSCRSPCRKGQIWVGNGQHSVALEPVALQRPTPALTIPRTRAGNAPIIGIPA